MIVYSLFCILYPIYSLQTLQFKKDYFLKYCSVGDSRRFILRQSRRDFGLADWIAARKAEEEDDDDGEPGTGGGGPGGGPDGGGGKVAARETAPSQEPVQQQSDCDEDNEESGGQDSQGGRDQDGQAQSELCDIDAEMEEGLAQGGPK